MKYFTKAQIEEIRKQLATLGVRDTDLDTITELNGDEYVAIVQDGENKKVTVRQLIHDYLPDDIADGQDGKSAYDIWKEQPGNAGKSVAEFLAALKGEKGDPGAAGESGAPGPTGPQGPAGPAGVTSAVATIDNGTGIPRVDVALNNGHMLLAFHNLKASGGGGGTNYTAGAGINITNDVISQKSATSDELGGIKTGYTENGRNFAVKLNDAKKAYVTVPGGDGGIGQNGGYYEQIFTAVAHGSSAPSLPSNDATIDDLGTWKHYVDDQAASLLGDYDVWMAIRWVAGSGTPDVWKGPWNITGAEGDAGADGTDIEFIYTQTANEQAPTPARPTSSDPQAQASAAAQNAAYGTTSYQLPDWYPINWTDNPVGVTSTIRLEWMSFRLKTGGAGGEGGTWGNFSAPVVWSAYGHQGIDGDGIEYIYALGATAPSGGADPNSWTSDPDFQDREYIPSGYANTWKDNPIDLSSAAPGTKQWVSVRKKYVDDVPVSPFYSNPYWHEYASPVLWNYKAKDGDAGTGIVADLQPNMFYVPCDADGTISAAFTGTTTVALYNGGPTVAGASIVTADITVKDTKAIPTDYTSQGWVTVNGMVITVSIPASATINFNETQLQVAIPVTGTVNGVSVERTTYLTIVGVHFGTNGDNGVGYQLKTNASVIRRRDGVNAPQNITVSVLKFDGDDDFTEYTPVATASTQALPIGLSITYIVDDDTIHEVTLASNSISTADVTDNIVIRVKLSGDIIIQDQILLIEEPSVPETQQALKSIVFKRYAFGATVVAPGNNTNPSSLAFGGTFENPVPRGWSDGVPTFQTGTNLYMTTRIFTSDGEYPQQSGWTEPKMVSDTESFDYEFAYMQPSDVKPVVPNVNNRHKDAYPYGYEGQVWFDPTADMYKAAGSPENVLRDFENMYWMAISEKIDGVNGAWTILRIRGEKGDPGIKGEDALPVRIRNWNEVYGVTLTGDQKIFSGFEDDAPFRDIIVVTPQDYPYGVDCPFLTDGVQTPVLLVVNYSTLHSDGYSTVGYPNTNPAPDLVMPNGAESSGTRNWTHTLYQDRAASEEALDDFGFQWSVFQNLGAVYIQLLVATQAYIGGLTVDHMTTSNGNNSSIEIQNGLITIKDVNGKVRIVIGQETGDSDPVLKFYDSDGTSSTLGTLLYDLGPGGIVNANGPINLPEWTRYKAVMKNTSTGGNFDADGTETINPSSAVSIYKYEVGYRLLESPVGSGHYAQQYMDPFNPNSFSGTEPALNGDYFDNYYSRLDSSTYTSHLKPLGEYIIMPISEDRTSGRITAPVVRINTLNDERHINTNLEATFIMSGDNYILSSIAPPLQI